MSSDEKVIEILEAFDLTWSYRGNAEHRSEQAPTTAPRTGSSTRSREGLEMVGQPPGMVRAEVCHDKLVALGYTGSESG